LLKIRKRVKGLAQANKVMHMEAIAYNLKKYQKTIDKKVKSGAKVAHLLFHNKSELSKLFRRYVSHPFFNI